MWAARARGDDFNWNVPTAPNTATRGGGTAATAVGGTQAAAAGRVAKKPASGKATGKRKGGKAVPKERGRNVAVLAAVLDAPPGRAAKEARRVLDEKGVAPQRQRDGRLWTAVMSALRARKRGDKAVELYDTLPAALGVQRTTVHANTALDACGKAGDAKAALAVFERMPADGLERTAVTYNVTLAALYRAGRHAEGVRLFRSMGEAGVQPDSVTYNTALSLATEAGLDEEAASIQEEADAAAAS